MKTYSSLSEIQRKGTQKKKEPPGDQRVDKHLLSTLILQPGGFFLAALSPGLLSTSSRAELRALPAALSPSAGGPQPIAAP